MTTLWARVDVPIRLLLGGGNMGKRAFVFFALALGLALAACSAVIDSEGAKIGNPKDFAEATHIARLSQEAAQATTQAVMLGATATTAAIQSESTRQAQNVKATATAAVIALQAEQAQADTVTASQPANIVRNALVAFGVGVGGLILAVGLAFGGAAWVMRRATSIYPNAQGQYPVMVSRGFGWVTYHDPSRGLGAGAVYRVPTALDVAAGAFALLKGQPAPRPELTAEYPANGSEPAMVQLSSQAQAVSLMAAMTRPTGILGDRQAIDAHEARQLASQLVSGGAGAVTLPRVRVIDDPAKIADFGRYLVEGNK
jgi:hypothetical protein